MITAQAHLNVALATFALIMCALAILILLLQDFIILLLRLAVRNECYEKKNEIEFLFLFYLRIIQYI
jgi:hypothetical protein